jgi:hypothetical protein
MDLSKQVNVKKLVWVIIDILQPTFVDKVSTRSLGDTCVGFFE